MRKLTTLPAHATSLARVAFPARLVRALLILGGMLLVAAPRLLLAADAMLIEFSSGDCRYCEYMKPVVHRLTSDGITVRRVDVARESAMAERFAIRQLPTYVVMHGGKERSRMVGVQKEETLRRALRQAEEVDFQHTGSQTPHAPLTRLASRGEPTVTPAATSSNAEPMPSAELANAVARAEAATVRLRVFEDVGFGVGTGTIIDQRDNNYLVLTCGHLFRESDGQGRIEVDLFHGGQKHTVPGRVLDYNAEDRDIALVTIQSPLQITPVPLLGDRSQIRNGDSVFSFGCDRGADPSRIDTRITGIDKYNQHLELSNIEIAGAPIDGRSGGGLFNARGQLIGVCNAADYNDNIGIYAGPGEVAWQLQRVNLTQLLDSSPVAAPGGGQFAAANTSSAAAGPSSDPTAAPMPINPPNNPPNNPSTNPSAGQQPTAPALATGGAGNGEVIIFYRDPNRPDAAPRVKVFSQPPAELLRFVQ